MNNENAITCTWSECKVLQQGEDTEKFFGNEKVW
jgi:hypothetical protein